MITNDRLVIKRILLNKVVSIGSRKLMVGTYEQEWNDIPTGCYISEAMISIISREDVKPLDCNQDSIH